MSHNPHDAVAIADALLDAQVAHHLARLDAPLVPETVARLADDVLDAVADQPLGELVDAAVIVDIVRRALSTVPASPAVGGILEMVAEIVVAGPPEAFPVGDLVPAERVEVLLDRLLAVTPVLERALERLTDTAVVGTVASRFMGRIVGEVLQANKAVADKVPGLGSLMSFGTSAASRVRGAADKQFEGLVGDAMGRGGTFAVRRLNRILVETLRDPTTREAVLQVWDLLSREPVRGVRSHVEAEELAGVVDAGHELAISVLASAPVEQLVEVVVAAFFDRFGGYTPTELLVELELDRRQLVDDLVRLAPGVIGAVRDSGALEAFLRRQLEPFYRSPEVRAILR